MGKHTPGPWTVSKHGTPAYALQFGVYASDDTNDFAIVRYDNAEANANLISAAPELLEALEWVLRIAEDNLKSYTEMRELDGYNDDNSEEESGLVCARAAIRKARGE